MSENDSNTILKRLKLLGLEITAGSTFIVVLVIYIWAHNAGSSWQTVLLWIAIIPVVIFVTGVQILLDIKRLASEP